MCCSLSAVQLFQELILCVCMHAGYKERGEEQASVVVLGLSKLNFVCFRWSRFWLFFSSVPFNLIGQMGRTLTKIRPQLYPDGLINEHYFLEKKHSCEAESFENGSSKFQTSVRN